MIPTKEQFLDFIELVKAAREREDKIDNALREIWDASTGQHAPFIISAYLTPLCTAFNLLFCIEDNPVVGNELEWWLTESEPCYWDADGTKHDLSSPEAFYDYLVKVGYKGEVA